MRIKLHACENWNSEKEFYTIHVRKIQRSYKTVQILGQPVHCCNGLLDCPLVSSATTVRSSGNHLSLLFKYNVYQLLHKNNFLMTEFLSFFRSWPIVNASNGYVFKLNCMLSRSYAFFNQWKRTSFPLFLVSRNQFCFYLFSHRTIYDYTIVIWIVRTIYIWIFFKVFMNGL